MTFQNYHKINKQDNFFNEINKIFQLKEAAAFSYQVLVLVNQEYLNCLIYFLISLRKGFNMYLVEL